MSSISGCASDGKVDLHDFSGIQVNFRELLHNNLSCALESQHHLPDHFVNNNNKSYVTISWFFKDGSNFWKNWMLSANVGYDNRPTIEAHTQD